MVDFFQKYVIKLL